MKTLWAIILIFVLTDNLTGQNTRKNTFPIRITVCDSINHEPLFLATISLTQDNHKIIAGSSDAQGEYLFPSVQTGVYKLKVSFIGYKTYTDTIRITGDFSRHILLAPDQVVMQEVIVTARESHGMTSSSIIDRKAMEHLQPSSFSGYGISLVLGRHQMHLFDTVKKNTLCTGEYYDPRIGRDFYLPFQLIVRTQEDCKWQEIPYTREEIRRIAQQRLEGYCKNLEKNAIQIQEKSVIIKASVTEISVEGTLEALVKASRRTETEKIKKQEGTGTYGIDTTNVGHSD